MKSKRYSGLRHHYTIDRQPRDRQGQLGQEREGLRRQLRSNRFQLTWNSEEAERALYSYLETYQLLDTKSVVAEPVDDHDILVKGGQYVVGAFVADLREKKSPEFDYFETIAKGDIWRRRCSCRIPTARHKSSARPSSTLTRRYSFTPSAMRVRFASLGVAATLVSSGRRLAFGVAKRRRFTAARAVVSARE